MPSAIALYRYLLPALLAGLLSGRAIAQQATAPWYRIQYHHDRWKAFHTDICHLYFPEGADSLCAFVVARLPALKTRVAARMGGGTEQAPNILLYPSADRLYASNAGSALPATVTLPTFIARGNRILLAYTGSYTALEDQLGEALVRATWETALESGLVAQAAGLSRDAVPYWMKEGMIRYFARGWPVAAEDELGAAIGADSPATWDAVIARRPVLAGQALCYYLATAYYPEAPQQLYFLLRKRKPPERALRLLTKTETGSLYAACLQFYRQRAGRPADPVPADSGAVLFRAGTGEVLSLLAGRDGAAFAYVLATPHRRTLYCYDTRTRRRSRVATYDLPPWLEDCAADPYPLYTWTAGGDLLAALPVKGVVTLRRYDRSGRRLDSYPLAGIDGISTLAIPNAPGGYLLAAWRRGQSDIVTYDPHRDRYTPLTLDAWDDRLPVPAPDGQSLVFASRRPRTAAKEDTAVVSGVFRLQDGPPQLLLPDSPAYVVHGAPLFLDRQQLLVATTAQGRSHAVLLRNLRQPGDPGDSFAAGTVQYLAAQDELLQWRQAGDSIGIRTQGRADWLAAHRDTSRAEAPWLADYERAAARRAREDSILRGAADAPPSFIDAVLRPGADQRAARRDSLRQARRYIPQRAEPYILQLYSAYFTARVNNDYFINRYQPYAAYQGRFKFPATGALAQGGFSDLFENHHFTIAYRLPAGSEGSDFLVRYSNTARRLDWGLAYYRKAEDLRPDPRREWRDESGRLYPNTAKVKTNYAELTLQYPLNYDAALGAVLALRHDRTYFPATDRYSLDFPAIRSLWSLLTLSYTQHRLRPTLPLLYRGFKMRVAADVFKGFTQGEEALTGLSLHGEYHRPLYRYITLVAQLSAGTSGGDRRVLYNLGGVDNNITPRVDSSVHLAQEAPYAFQTLVTPLRGYYQNSLYGSRYALLNVDVYFPLFQSLVPVETPLSAINNLQLGLFADVAAAGGDRRYSTAARGGQWAYGFSARTTLAGYPLRFDMAWPGSFAQRPVWYLSLSLQ